MMMNSSSNNNVAYMLVHTSEYVQDAPSFRKASYERLYRKYNPYVLLAHVVNMVATLACFFAKFRLIPENYVFVSPVAQLRWTKHALLLVNQTENKCHLAIPPLKTQLVYPDFMPHALYDFTGKHLVSYDDDVLEFHVIWAMFSFFALSVLFQWAHYSYILSDPLMPRVLHYIEYAFSSSLMIMVMGINMGIVDLMAVIGLCAAFFGMNMLGAAAEGLCHFGAWVPQHTRPLLTQLMWLLHLAGWVLFFLAMVPIWVQLQSAIRCSDGGTPGFVIAAVTVESVCFFLFGFLQVSALAEKAGQPPHAELLFKYDCLHALLSLVAKTLLAWLLMGPAASVVTSSY
jgi:hypothetical protein